MFSQKVRAMESRNQEQRAFTGRTRIRSPKRSVLAADKTARWVISIGGLGGIVAVSVVGLFLLYVVIPLFRPSQLSDAATTDAADGGPAILSAGIDEFGRQAWTLRADGTFAVERLDSGETLAVLDPMADRIPVAWSHPGDDGSCAFGFADGSAALGNLEFSTSFPPEKSLPAPLRNLPADGAASYAGGVLDRTPDGQFRLQTLAVSIDEPADFGSAPVRLVDLSSPPQGPVLAVLTADRMLHVAQVTRQRNLLTGKTTSRLVRGAAPLPDDIEGMPGYLIVNGLGDNALVAWKDGRALRFDISRPESPNLAERVDLTPVEGVSLTSLSSLTGKTSLVVGDDAGGLEVWFRIRPVAAQTGDGTVLTRAFALPAGDSAVVATAASARSRMLATAHIDGTVRLLHATSRRELAEIRTPGGTAASALAIGPRDDVLLAVESGAKSLWRIDAPHPEISLTTLAEPVWYEGYEEPSLVWQSSSASDDFEPKYSLMPLIFGTLKATLYCMLFGLPLALLAAVYTNEFLHPRLKARIKPTV